MKYYVFIAALNFSGGKEFTSSKLTNHFLNIKMSSEGTEIPVIRMLWEFFVRGVRTQDEY